MQKTQSTDPNAAYYVAPSSLNPTGGSQAAANLGWYQAANGQITTTKYGDTNMNVGSTLNQTPSSGFVSSAQPTVNNQTGTAVSGSTSTLTGSTGNTGTNPQGTGTAYQPTSGEGGGVSMYDQNGNLTPQGFVNYATNQIVGAAGASRDAILGAYNMTIQNAALANQSLQLQYNTALGKMNQEYAQNMQQLQTQHMNTIGSAVSQMAAADPMGVNSSSFATGYIGKINDMYSQTVGFLNAAYQQQQTALMNGEAEQAIAIQQGINNANAQLGSQIANLNSSMMQALVGAQQSGVQMSQFQQSKQLQAQGIFNTQLSSMSLPMDALTNSGLVQGYNKDGQPQMNLTLMKGLNDWISTGQMPTGLSSDQSRALMTIINDPTFQTGLQAGYQPSQIVQQMVQGSYRQQQIGLETSANIRAWQVAGAQYGNAVGGGGGGTSTSASTMSSWGQGLINQGGAALAAHPEVLRTLTDISTAASPTNVNQLTDFVQTGSDNKLANVLGGVLNNLFGANLGDITSSKDLISSGATYLSKLGIDPKSLSNLANQSPQTRAKVVIGILNGIESQLTTQSNMNSKVYNLSPIASDLDNAYQTIEAAKKQLGSTADPVGTATSNMSDFFNQSMSNWFK